MRLEIPMQEAMSNVGDQSMTGKGSNSLATKSKNCVKSAASLQEQPPTTTAGHPTNKCAKDPLVTRKHKEKEKEALDDAKYDDFCMDQLRPGTQEIAEGLSTRKKADEISKTEYDNLVESRNATGHGDSGGVSPRASSHNVNFGPFVHSAGSFRNREEYTDNELRRRQVTRQLGGPVGSEYSVMKRGMVIPGGQSNQYDQSQLMQPQHFWELHRMQMLHRDQLPLSLDQHYRMQREKKRLDLLRIHHGGTSLRDRHELAMLGPYESSGAGLTARERILLSRDRITDSSSIHTTSTIDPQGTFCSGPPPFVVSQFLEPCVSLRSVQPRCSLPNAGVHDSTNHLSFAERVDIVVAAAQQRRSESAETFHMIRNSVFGKRSFSGECELQGHSDTAAGKAPLKRWRDSSILPGRPAHLPTKKVPSPRNKDVAVDAALSTENIIGSASPTSYLNGEIAQLIEVYSHGGMKEAPFPLKLHAILANPAYEDIIGWLPHGKAWKIFQVSLFEGVLVPLHFRHAKYASFMRQGKNQKTQYSQWFPSLIPSVVLTTTIFFVFFVRIVHEPVNGWGFQRKSHHDVQEHNAYCHDLFVRDDPKKCLTMIRFGAKKNAAGKHVSATSSTDGESAPPKKKCASGINSKGGPPKKRSTIAPAASCANDKSDAEGVVQEESRGEVNITQFVRNNTGNTSDSNEEDCSDCSSADKDRKLEISSTSQQQCYQMKKSGKKSKRGRIQGVDSPPISTRRKEELLEDKKISSGKNENNDDNDKMNAKYEKGSSNSSSSSSDSSQEMIQIPLKKRRIL